MRGRRRLSVSLVAAAALLAGCPLLAEAQAKTVTDVKPNKIIPEDGGVDGVSVKKAAREACSVVSLSRKPEELDRGKNYPTTSFGLWPGGEQSVIAWMMTWQRTAEEVQGNSSGTSFKQTVQSCSSDAQTTGIGATCDSAWVRYFQDLAWPYAIPLCLGLLMVFTHSVCCFVACCRCCRRMICCREHEEPIKTRRSTLVCAVIVWIGSNFAALGFSALSLEASESLHVALETNMCIALTFADEAMGGAGWFLGTGIGQVRLQSIAEALDVDKKTTQTVREVLAASITFDDKYSLLRRRVAHVSVTLGAVGSGRRIFDHRCVFCNLALGQGVDSKDAAPSFQYPKEGLLVALHKEIEGSSAESLAVIRRDVAARLTGSNLTDFARRMKKANNSMAIFDEGLRTALSRNWAKRRPMIMAVESIRSSIFILQQVFVVLCAFFGTLALIITKIRVDKIGDSGKPPPSGKLHGCAWCCGFMYGSSALFWGGAMLMIAMPAAEACLWVRFELLSHQGLDVYAPALCLLPEEGVTADAVSLARACFAANRTGDLLLASGLGNDLLDFQPKLSDAFSNLDVRIAEPNCGIGTPDLLVSLREAAERFGGVFVLDPTVNSSDLNQISHGLLELSPAVVDLILGSGLQANDEQGPDTISTIRGLNAVGELIAGPGQYTFLHGTAGGGIVVTPDSPKAAEIQSVPVYVRSALLYAQGKERLIASNNSLRCDVLPPVGAAQVKLCGVTEFRQWLLSEVSLLEQAVATTNNEADAVKGRFLSDLKDALQPMLGWIRSLLQAFNCNAMWRRVEELDRSFCEEVAPLAAKGTLMMMLLAACAICSIIVQYKAWRRLKDNKILQEEVERFERRLRAHAIKMQEQDARQREEHGLSAMAPTGVSLQLDDELDEDEEQEDFSDHPLH